MDCVEGGYGLEERQGSEQTEGRRKGSSWREHSTNKERTLVPSKAEHRVQDVEKRKMSKTKRMALDFLMNVFSGWMLECLDFKQEEAMVGVWAEEEYYKK